MKKVKYLLVLMVFVSFFYGCSDENPYNFFVDPLSDGALDSDGNWQEWVLYHNELRTGGGMMFYASPEGTKGYDVQKINFYSTSNPRTGRHCIKYTWTGEEVYAYEDEVWQNDWAGFGLIVGEDWEEYDDVTVDLSESGYTKIELYARGSGTARFESPDGKWDSTAPNDTTGDIDLTNTWKKHTMNFTPGKNVKHYLSIILKSSGGESVTLYVDDIRYK